MLEIPLCHYTDKVSLEAMSKFGCPQAKLLLRRIGPGPGNTSTRVVKNDGRHQMQARLIRLWVLAHCVMEKPSTEICPKTNH